MIVTTAGSPESPIRSVQILRGLPGVQLVGEVVPQEVVQPSLGRARQVVVLVKPRMPVPK